MDILSFEHVFVYYDSSPALLDISFELTHPFLAMLIGPNGAGKTTLLKVILGLVKPKRGEISVFGLDPSTNSYEIRGIVGYVPQLIHVDENVPLRVKEIVAMGLLSRRRPPRILFKRDEEKINEYLELLEIEDLVDKTFRELSGGEKQKVLIARALVRRPRLLLLDEPFSMLDIESKSEIADTMIKLMKDFKMSIIIASHELSPCMQYDPTVILLNKRIYAIGKAEEVLTEVNLRKTYPGITKLRELVIASEDHA